MITFNKGPKFCHEWPIVGWDENVPVRSKEINLKLDIDITFNKEDDHLVRQFVAAYQALYENATSKESRDGEREQQEGIQQGAGKSIQEKVCQDVHVNLNRGVDSIKIQINLTDDLCPEGQEPGGKE
jgi:hypothetical protein